MATVRAIDAERSAMTVELDDGSAQPLDLSRLAGRHVRSGWGQTVHAAQGATSERVMAHLESLRASILDARAAYVAISRARSHIIIYTDNRDRLADVLGIRNQQPVAALDGAAIGIE